jgi:hypothetical protein
MGNVAYKPVAPEQIEYPWWDEATQGNVVVWMYPSLITNIEVGMNLNGNNVVDPSQFRVASSQPVIDVGMNSSGDSLATMSNLRTTSSVPVVEVGMNRSGNHLATMSQLRPAGLNNEI